MPDVPAFVGAAAGGVLALSLFVITTQRTDIRELAGSEASESDWRRRRAKARLVLLIATVLLVVVSTVAFPAAVDVAQGQDASGLEYVAAAAFVFGLMLWPFAAGNVRMAAGHLAERRRQVYGLE